MAINIPSYLYLNPYGVYYFRIAIPLGLRDFLGRREIKKSLRTSNRRQAILSAQNLAAKVNGVFEEMRSMAGGKNPDTGIIILKGFKKENGTVTVDEFHVDLDDKKKEVEIAEALFASINNNPEALKGVVTAAAAATERGNEPLSHVINKYRDEKMTENWTAGTLKEFDGMFGYVTEILGDLPINTIGYPEAERLKETLLKLPPSRKTSPLYRNLSIQQILATRPKKTLSRKTVNKYLSLVSNLFNYAKRYGYTDENYFQGVGVKIKQKPHEERKPFTTDDLAKLFSPENYRPDKFRFDYMRWTPLIGLYTGMRLEEICQLHAEDIRQVDGIWVFDIKSEGDRTVKTASSERLVPVHSELIRIGLLERVAQLKKKGVTMLFPELETDKFGKYSSRVSKWFNARYRPKCGVTKPGKVFHSFRHSVTDKLRQRDTEDKKVKAILGHADPDTTSGYGNQYGPILLKNVIEQLVYDLPEIKPYKS
jgi:integrase